MLEKSAYDLFLTREVKRAELVRTPGVKASVDLFFAENLDALAGLKPLLIELVEKHDGTRVKRPAGPICPKDVLGP